MQTLHNGDRIDKVASAEHANDVRVEVFQSDLFDDIFASTAFAGAGSFLQDRTEN